MCGGGEKMSFYIRRNDTDIIGSSISYDAERRLINLNMCGVRVLIERRFWTVNDITDLRPLLIPLRGWFG